MKYLGKSFQFFTGVTEGPKTADLDEVFAPPGVVRCINCGREVDLSYNDRVTKHTKWCTTHYCPDCCKL
jgi:hypothetical protein